MHGVRPEIEEGPAWPPRGPSPRQARGAASDHGDAVERRQLEAKVQKFSAPPTVDSTGKPTPDSGRDLALLRVQDGIYPAIGLTTREVQIGDPVHILGFWGRARPRAPEPERDPSSLRHQRRGVRIQVDVINQDLVQTDAPAAHGNSGGPAITDEATVVA